MMNRTQSKALFEQNSRFIPGGVVSLNRKVEPEIAFVRGQGAHMWDADGNQYLDYHAAFGPYLLGHNNPDVEGAVMHAIQSGQTLTGTGTTPWEGRAAELLVQCVPTLEKVQFTNTGSEATYLAIRLARAHTGRDHICVMQGGYNGWHDEVACNVMTPLDQLGPQISEGEYPFVPMSAGISPRVKERVHVLQYNDLASLEWAFKTYEVACLISEPILQNIGVVKPHPGYLQGVRDLCDKYGVVYIMDEVKTGFRHALGGYQSIAGVVPDLAVYGKAIANGYPLGALGGKAEIMNLFNDPDLSKRVLIAGTYNGHPVPIAAAIGTMEKLLREPETYTRLESFGARVEDELTQLFHETGRTAVVARQSSAWCVYFMDHAPTSWHDLATHHDMSFDLKFRRALIERGIYFFPLPTKQCSISSAHSEDDIARTLQTMRDVLQSMPPERAATGESTKNADIQNGKLEHEVQST
jgi:glutamate-1-semialdehyde 2,1-aminomutase